MENILIEFYMNFFYKSVGINLKFLVRRNEVESLK